LFVDPERAESLPGKGNGDPSLLSSDRIPGLLNGSHLVEDSFKPRPSLSAVAKGKELVPTGERGHAGYENVLEIIELKHRNASDSRPMHVARQKGPIRRA
jgi:hypothetical protein